MPLKSSALDRFKGTYKSSSGLLLPLIERHVMRDISTRENPERSEDWLHPSDMAKADWCGRHDYYRIKGTPRSKKTGSNPSFRMENIFTEGHAIHAKYQKWLWEMGVLAGDWKCHACGLRWFAYSPTQCRQCSSERLEYLEYVVRRKSHLMEGHSDAAVHLPARALVEIKSIGIRTLAFEAPRLYQRYLDGEKAEDIWMAISHPFGSHMRQGQLYLWMTWPLYDQIIFLYESKFHQQVKEFVVDYNPSIVAPLLEVAREVSQCLRNGYVPDRPTWAEDAESKTCSSCPYRPTCWSEDAHQEETAVAAPRVKRAGLPKRKRALRQAG